MHAKMHKKTRSAVWAEAIRAVLGENFLTDDEAKAQHAKTYDKNVSFLTQRKEQLKVVINFTKKSLKDASDDAQKKIFKEKLDQEKSDKEDADAGAKKFGSHVFC